MRWVRTSDAAFGIDNSQANHFAVHQAGVEQDFQPGLMRAQAFGQSAGFHLECADVDQRERQIGALSACQADSGLRLVRREHV